MWMRRLAWHILKQMRLLDVTLGTLTENLALDEALLLEAEAGRSGEVLRFWEWPAPAVVLGAGGIVGQDVIEKHTRDDGVPVARRSSGGGTVVLGRGCLCFTLVLAMDGNAALREVRPSYCFILGKLIDALDGLLPDFSCAGTSDLAAAGRKVSGNAQQRKRNFLLHHGTMLYDFDLSQVGRYLQLPPRQPMYRGGRGHADFLKNLPASSEQLKERLGRCWQATEPLADWPVDLVHALVAEKYNLEGWVRRR